MNGKPLVYCDWATVKCLSVYWMWSVNRCNFGVMFAGGTQLGAVPDI